MRVLVCGGRNYGLSEPERMHVLSVLEQFAIDNSECYNPNDNWLPSDIEIISGMAKGVDTVAVDWAVVNWCRWHAFPALWKVYGNSAGFIRNKQMLEEGKPDIVIAFPGGKGTENMKAQARLAGIQVMEIPPLKPSSNHAL